MKMRLAGAHDAARLAMASVHASKDLLRLRMVKYVEFTVALGVMSPWKIDPLVRKPVVELNIGQSHSFSNTVMMLR